VTSHPFHRAVEDRFDDPSFAVLNWGLGTCLVILIGEGVVALITNYGATLWLSRVAAVSGHAVAAARFPGLFGLLWRASTFLFVYYVISGYHQLPFRKAMGVVIPRAKWLAVAAGASGALVLLCVAWARLDGNSAFTSAPANTDVLGIALYVVASCCTGPLVEELIFRGVLFPPLMKRWGLWAAILIVAGVFGLEHLGDPIGFLMAFVIGVCLTWLRAKSRSIIPCMLTHVTLNSVLSYPLIVALVRR